MNPMRYRNEIDYYVTLLEKYEKCVNSEDLDLDTFISREIIEVMDELKSETENVPLMQDIAKNTLIILLSFYHDRRNEEYYTYFCDLDDSDKKFLRKRFVPLLT